MIYKVCKVSDNQLKHLFKLKKEYDEAYIEFKVKKIHSEDYSREEMNNALAEIRLLDYIDKLEELYNDKA